MRRNPITTGALALAALAFPLGLTRADDTTGRTPVYLPVPPPLRRPVVPPEPAAAPGVVKDLVKLLEKTKSRETYLATVVALAEMGEEARLALPAVLEHGERLGMFKGLCEAGGDRSFPGGRVLEAVAKIAGGERFPVPTVTGYAPPPPGAVPTMPGRVLDRRW